MGQMRMRMRHLGQTTTVLGQIRTLSHETEDFGQKPIVQCKRLYHQICEAGSAGWRKTTNGLTLSSNN